MIKTMTKAQIAVFFQALHDANPNPVGELESVNTFTLLVAVVLSAQATDKGVNRATRPLFQVADTPEKMLALGEQGLKDFIKTIGLYNAKAKNIIRLCEMLIKEHNSQVPHDRTSLEKLPGVGRKTANVVLNIAFGEPTMAVDTHIFRLGNRTGLAKGKTPLEVENRLLKRIPQKWIQDAHHWLILHGRYICTARKPKCGECVVKEVCQFDGKVY